MMFAVARNHMALLNDADNEGESPIHDAARNGNLPNMQVMHTLQNHQHSSESLAPLCTFLSRALAFA